MSQEYTEKNLEKNMSSIYWKRRIGAFAIGAAIIFGVVKGTILGVNYVEKPRTVIATEYVTEDARGLEPNVREAVSEEAAEKGIDPSGISYEDQVFHSQVAARNAENDAQFKGKYKVTLEKNKIYDSSDYGVQVEPVKDLTNPE